MRHAVNNRKICPAPRVRAAPCHLAHRGVMLGDHFPRKNVLLFPSVELKKLRVLRKTTQFLKFWEKTFSECFVARLVLLYAFWNKPNRRSVLNSSVRLEPAFKIGKGLLLNLTCCADYIIAHPGRNRNEHLLNQVGFIILKGK